MEKNKRTPNSFHFQHFSINQDRTAMKIGMDSVLLGTWCPTPQIGRILDIGTGTGLLALLLAQRTECSVDAIEIDSEACMQATENVNNSPYRSRISVLNTSLQLYETVKTYDTIISNPPYFEDSLKSTDLSRNTARHTDTLSFESLFEFAFRLLSNEGNFCIVVPLQSFDRIIEVALESKLYCVQRIDIKGKNTKIAKRVLLEFRKTDLKLSHSTMSIRDADGSYSEQFKLLTKDFYLPSMFK